MKIQESTRLVKSLSVQRSEECQGTSSKINDKFTASTKKEGQTQRRQKLQETQGRLTGPGGPVLVAVLAFYLQEKSCRHPGKL